MKLKIQGISLLILLLFPIFISAQRFQMDLEMVYKIKHEEKTNSTIEDLSYLLTDFVGPRLTASKGKLRANEWIKKKMEVMGLENVIIDEVNTFDRGGWDNKRTYIAMTEPYYSNFSAIPKAWTGSTDGEISGKVILVDIKNDEDFDKYKGQLQNKIVLLHSKSSYKVSFESFASRYTDEELENIQKESYDKRRWGNFNYVEWRKMRKLRAKIITFLNKEGAAIILHSAGEFNVPKANGARYKSGDPQLIPELNLPIEAHGRMMRLIQNNVDVALEVDIQNEFSESPMVTNVMGEIPGTDSKLKDQIVLIGAHLDSWHGGTGAADNASGCIVMLEAMRILKALKIEPRRTIRIALWGGEEQGLLGSKGYVNKYLRNLKNDKLNTEFKNFQVYFNMDNGTGKFRGIYLQENEMIRPIFEEWIKAFKSMGMEKIAINNTRGTDHLSFNALGLPAFQFIQDEIEYARGYHSNMDTFERLLIGDLKNNAVIIAAFVYQAAMRDEQLPKKPYVAPKKFERKSN